MDPLAHIRSLPPKGAHASLEAARRAAMNHDTHRGPHHA
jgi:hypothetical protein